jgi:hypothetical protein
VAAAQASFQAGAFDAALELAATAEAGPLGELQHARVDLVRAHVALASGFGSNAAHTLLLEAGRQLEPFDADLARETYLAAWAAAGFAGSIGEQGALLEICRAILALPPPVAPGPLHMLVDGLALTITDGHAAATVPFRRAADPLMSIPVEDVLRWGWMAANATLATWDFEGMHALSIRQVQLVRDAGALAALPLHLTQLGMALSWIGDSRQPRRSSRRPKASRRQPGARSCPPPWWSFERCKEGKLTLRL